MTGSETSAVAQPAETAGPVGRPLLQAPVPSSVLEAVGALARKNDRSTAAEIRIAIRKHLADAAQEADA